MLPLSLPSNYIVGYVRVSKAEQGLGWSPSNQEAAIRRFAEQHHLTVAGIFADIGRSGATLRNRRGLRDLLLVVREGGIGAVIAWREDRLGRRMREGIALSREIHATKAHILCLEPFVHDSGPQGADHETLLLRPLLQIQAQEEWETIRRRVVPGLKTAAINGRRGGHLPFGYLRMPAGPIAISTADAAIVVRSFQAVVAGTPVSALVRNFAEEGLRRSGGRSLTFDLINGILRNPYVCGTLLYRLPQGVEGAGQVVKHLGHHPTIIDPALFAQVQALLAQRRTRSLAHRRSNQHAGTAESAMVVAPPSLIRDLDVMAAISGPPRSVHGIVPPNVARCGHCGAPMYATLQTCGARGRRRRIAVYLCHRHKREGARVCPQPPALAEDIDAAVSRHLRRAIAGGQFRHHLLPTLPPDLSHLDTSIAATTTRRDALQRAASLGTPSAGLRDRLATLVQEIERLTSERQRCAHSLRLPSGPRLLALQHFDDYWPTCDQVTRRDIIGWLLERVRIHDKAVQSVAFLGQAPPAAEPTPMAIPS